MGLSKAQLASPAPASAHVYCSGRGPTFVSLQIAQDTIKFLADKSPREYEAFECPDCGRFHLREKL